MDNQISGGGDPQLGRILRKFTFALSLIFIFAIPWEGAVALPRLGNGIKLVGFALVPFSLATVLVAGRYRKLRSFHIVLCLFVWWRAASVFWSANPAETAASLWTWVQLVGFVFIFWDLYTTREAITTGLQVFIFGEYVAIGNTVVRFFAGEVFYTHYQRFSPGDQVNPDGFGLMVALGLPVAWHLASSNDDTRLGHVLKFINYSYIPAAFLGVSLSGTRTAVFASIVAMTFGLASLTRLRAAARAAILLLLTSGVFILLPHVRALRSFERFGTIPSEMQEGDLNDRITIWSEGFAAFMKRPLTGVGSNMFRSVNTMGKVAHNTFLSVLAELGLIGLILFGIILAIAVIHALSLPPWDSRFWLTVLAVWAIGASTLTWETKKGTWFLLTFVVASAAAARQRDEADSSFNVASRSRTA